MTLLGGDQVSERFPGSKHGASSYYLDRVRLNAEHHDSLFWIAEQMREESDETDYCPTYTDVVKYALHMACVKSSER